MGLVPRGLLGRTGRRPLHAAQKRCCDWVLVQVADEIRKVAERARCTPSGKQQWAGYVAQDTFAENADTFEPLRLRGSPCRFSSAAVQPFLDNFERYIVAELTKTELYASRRQDVTVDFWKLNGGRNKNFGPVHPQSQGSASSEEEQREKCESADASCRDPQLTFGRNNRRLRTRPKKSR